jgi:hypothetical protein
MNDLDAPQWAIELSHQQRWDSYVIKVMLHNMEVDRKEQSVSLLFPSSPLLTLS